VVIWSFGVLGLRRGVFSHPLWQVTLCDPIWQATPCITIMGFPIKNLWLSPILNFTSQPARPSTATRGAIKCQTSQMDFKAIWKWVDSVWIKIAKNPQNIRTVHQITASTCNSSGEEQSRHIVVAILVCGVFLHVSIDWEVDGRERDITQKTCPRTLQP